MTTRSYLCLLLAFNACVLAEEAVTTPADLRRMFTDPPIDCWPRTRWWWMGNAMTNDDIKWQLHQMKDHGIGGVEQITMDEVYERGNNQYLSPEFLDQIRHTVDVAQSLGMSVSFNFGGPGWIFGGDWVPPEDQNRCLISSALELVGPRDFSGSLSMDATINPLDVPGSVRTIGLADQLVAVVAGKVTDGKLAETSLTDLTNYVTGRELHWSVPDGRWRVMAFWLTKVGDGVVDHFNKFHLPSHYADRDIRLLLDLGSVGNVAEVEINDTPVGARWYRSQQMDVTEAVHVGENSLVVRVTNTLINRIAGLKRMPSVPDELAGRLGKGVHDADSTTLGLLNFGPLPRSGLLGPVRVLPQKRVMVPMP